MDGNEPLTQPKPGIGNLPNGILILGAAKSGTTGLFYAIQNALATGYNISVPGLFEPRRSDEVKHYCQTSTDQIRLVKMLLGPLGRGEYEFLELFDKKIMIFRDPRDNVVSRIHFMLPKFVNWREKDKVQQILKLFTEKEEKPNSVSVLSVVRGLERISGREGLAENVRANSVLPAQFKRSHGDAFHMMPYDELVNGQFESLSKYLGFSVPNEFELSDKHAHLVRSKNSGAWRNWFLDEDVQFFAREVAEDFRVLGFDPEATPSSDRQVDPAKTSAYVKAMFDRLEQKRKGRSKRAEKVDESPGDAARSFAVSGKDEAPAPPPPKALEDFEARKARRERRRKQQAVTRHSAALNPQAPNPQAPNPQAPNPQAPNLQGPDAAAADVEARRAQRRAKRARREGRSGEAQ